MITKCILLQLDLAELRYTLERSKDERKIYYKASMAFYHFLSRVAWSNSINTEQQAEAITLFTEARDRIQDQSLRKYFNQKIEEIKDPFTLFETLRRGISKAI